jgi:hypothetical protein
MRILEMEGQAGEVQIQLKGTVRQAFEVNLLEDGADWGKITQLPVEIPVEGDTIKVHMRPYEFKTLQIHGSFSKLGSTD